MASTATEFITIQEIFNKMDYGPASEDRSVLDKWLQTHNKKFGHFIDNEYKHPEDATYKDSIEPCSGKVLASTLQGSDADVEEAVNSASLAYESWSKLSGHIRARHLYSFARTVQKHARLLAVLESLDNGKTIRESRDCDVPLVVRHLYYYAGWAQIMEQELPNWTSVGVVGAIVPWNFPLMLLAWKVCPALAAGNTVVLKPATNTRLSALLLAEIAAEAGIPAGVFNVVTGGGALGSTLAQHPLVDKVAFTGSTMVGQLLRRITAGSGKKLSLELGGKSPVIVFDSADVNSAIEGVVDAIWFNQGQVCSAGSRLLVQESIYQDFIVKLKHRMGTLRLGTSLDKTSDMSVVVSESQLKDIEKYVTQAKDEGAEVYQVKTPSGMYYPPTLITNVGPSNTCVIEEIFGPVLVAMSFRTAKEAVSLANNSCYGLGASVWTEKLPLALEVAHKVQAGAVWVNAHNLFDAAAGFGGYKHSGYGRDGGKEGLYEYIKPSWQGKRRFGLPSKDLPAVSAYTAHGPPMQGGNDKCNATIQSYNTPGEPLPPVDRTFKLHYGGAQKRPDANYCRVIPYAKGHALVGEANRKDMRNAVEAAVKAQAVWSKRTGFNRAQILYYLAENLSLRSKEMADLLENATGASKDKATIEVERSINALFSCAAYCDKYGGAVQETVLNGTVVRLHEPVGVVGVACPDQSPLLSFVSLVGAAVCRGNAAVVIASEAHPTLALSFMQIVDTSDVPGGVINLLTGSRDHLSRFLAQHHQVDTLWYFGGQSGAAAVEHESASNLKRTWTDYGEARDWADPTIMEEALYQATQVKNVWLPGGDIFAN